MDRRNFIGTLLASGVLGATLPAARAADDLFLPGANRVLIVGQSDQPYALELTAQLRQVFTAAGIPHMQAVAGGTELAQVAHVIALLEKARGGRVIGVMDDAAAVIFQELAAARGGACVLSTHHRFGAGAVRHCCTSATLEAGIVWSEPISAQAGRIAGVYAGAIGGRQRAAPTVPATGPADGGPASLVSFLINT